MAKPRTARAVAGKAGMFKRGLTMTTSPYRRGPHGAVVFVRIVAAKREGHHVRLTPAAGEGAPFLVDLLHPVFNVRDEQEALFE